MATIMPILQSTIGCTHMRDTSGSLLPLNQGTLLENPIIPSLFMFAVEPLLRSVEKNYKVSPLPQNILAQ